MTRPSNEGLVILHNFKLSHYRKLTIDCGTRKLRTANYELSCN
jgi:hypothetical protein